MLLLPDPVPEGEPATGLLRWVMEGRSLQDHETLRRTKSGEVIPVSVTAARMLAPDGRRVIGVSATFRDLRPRRAAEAARAALALRAGELVVWEVERPCCMDNSVQQQWPMLHLRRIFCSNSANLGGYH